jgi:hypothetical protein
VAVVVLKKLSDAIQDGDDILGVISGSATNQNHNEGLITVPHSGSQSALYRNVLSLSGLQSEAVSYVEGKLTIRSLLSNKKSSNKYLSTWHRDWCRRPSGGSQYP